MNNNFSDIDEKYKKFGLLLREFRISKNLTQKQMAHKLKVTQGLMSHMENGYSRISLENAQLIGKMFDVDYKYFTDKIK